MPPNEIRAQINFIKCSVVLSLYVRGDSSYRVKWKRMAYFSHVCAEAYIQSVQDIKNGFHLYLFQLSEKFVTSNELCYFSCFNSTVLIGVKSVITHVLIHNKTSSGM